MDAFGLFEGCSDGRGGPASQFLDRKHLYLISGLFWWGVLSFGPILLEQYILALDGV